MKIAILSNDPNIYSTHAIHHEAIRSGHQVDTINYLDCELNTDSFGKISLRYQNRTITHYDITIPRIGTYAFEHSMEVLKHFPTKKMLNSPSSIFLSKNKWHTATALAKKNIQTPTTQLVSKVTNLNNLQVKMPFILKKAISSKGLGTYLIQTEQDLHSLQNEIKQGNELFVAQEYINEALASDYRFIVLGNEVIASMKRVATPGEFRANVHLGATCSTHLPSEEEKFIAIQTTKSLGLEFAGIDIIKSIRGPLVLEANSSPGLERIQQISGVNIAKELIIYLENN